MVSTATQRRHSIMAELAQHHAVSVSDLSVRLGVSEVSIRRDLSHLERSGQLRRFHGGALAPADFSTEAEPASCPYPAVPPAKARIGEAAAALIQPGDRLIFDSGTTVLEVARHLPRGLRESGNLTAITNSLPIVNELGPEKDIHLILLGGIYAPRYQVVIGPTAVAQLATLHADKVFLGADGLTLSHGLTNANVLEAEVDRAAIAAASQVIVVAESSKIGAIGLTTLIPLTDIDQLITDQGAPVDFVAHLQALGIEVTLVDDAEPGTYADTCATVEDK
jgi:DeoR/GlpR family transcriptional regulator of sugar metabolism